MSDQAIEREVNRLNQLLKQVESSITCYASYEILDLNNSKRSRNAFHVSKMMRSQEDKPFIFLTALN